ncbi:MAG TPA: alpha-glucan family phosphorylase [Chthonomonadaceae bacterium]|nr:alpha-glucan family phosphorylase [Chthonomonadaceae bacterium]
MPTVHAFHVVPALPQPLNCLRELAFNLRWAWDHDTIEFFRRLDRDLWEQSGHNPVRMLGTIAQSRLREAAQDETFVAHMDRVCRSQESYLHAANTWFRRVHGDALKSGFRVAYFSMEFGITECLPIYSGGLGVLAGDHLKSSSDLDLPLAGVGLLYQQGYFRQYLNADGWQQERYPENDFYNMPLQPERDAQGNPVRISVDFPGRTVYAQVWRAQVGRIPLFLLDTNIPLNNATDQNITDQLYGGDLEMRLQQEIILGIGGMRALAAMGLQPTICHMNEGHSAFLALERARMLMEAEKVTFPEAQEATAAGNLFTTHTPVPAGFDIFPADLLGRYFGAYAQQLGLSFEEFMGLGRVRRDDAAEQFNMAVLALRHAHHCNGVSRLHAQVTRRMVKSRYREFPEDEIPISNVTNGIHTRSFISQEMEDLLDRYLGGRWSQDPGDASVWNRIEEIPDEDLWRVREFRRERLVVFARNRLKRQYEQRGMSDFEIRQVREVLNPEVLTIGFARRFATYKRATLLLSDPERLTRILTDAQRPVQILMAGKAHPRDDGGKDLIRQVIHFSRREEVRNRIVFLEDYDLSVARHLVQGVDVWLNTPRRLMEASGTSGMKVLANGGLNCSILDGWWDEGYRMGSQLGWAIGKGEEYADPDYQDKVEASALYDLLEKEIVPLFYDRGTDGLPRAWISRVKNSMKTLCPVFNTHRMVSEYAERYYLPATERYHRLTANGLKRAKELVDWKQRVRDAWPQVRVEKVTMAPDGSTTVPFGTNLHVTATVRLGNLTPEDVQVEAYHGPLDVNHQVPHGTPIALTWKSSTDGVHTYEGDVPCDNSGLQGFSVRILPIHEDVALPQELALITWE